MTSDPPNTHAVEPPAELKPVRLWPAWVIAAAQFIALELTVTPSIQNTTRFLIMMIAPLCTAALFTIWLLFASRLRIKEKLGLLLALAICPWISVKLSVDEPALQTTQWIYGGPLAVFMVTMALSIWPRSSSRALIAILALSLGWGLFPLLRNEGFDGDYYPQFAWRWSRRHEETLAPLSTSASPAPEVTSSEPSPWPQFRGPEANGAILESIPDQDWASKAPVELWRIPIGLGWSSFAYNDNRLYTQEQRGESEYISCYSSDDGALIWSNADESRFSEVVSGAGPRGTPTYDNGLIFALGGNGLLTCLNANDGHKVWQRNLVAELDAPVPMWGFSGSPLAHDDKVIVYIGARDNRGLVAFDRKTGEIKWSFPSRGMNYTTAHAMKFDGETMIVFCDGQGVHALSPETGEPIWNHRPDQWEGPPMVDPQQLSSDSLIVALGDGIGTVRLQVSKDGSDWSVKPLWLSNKLRPSFNDTVSTGPFLYGFNRAIFTCIDAETGERKWQGGRFGFGQTILLKNSAKLIIAAENGDLAVVNATPDRFEELRRIPVLNDKTWNHPIVVGDRVFLRNGKVAVCLRLGS